MLKICPHALSLEVKLELILIPCGRPEVLKLRFYWWIHKAYRELITTSVVFGIGYESPLSPLCFISFPPFFHSHPSLDWMETLISDQPLISVGCLTRNIFFLHFWEIQFGECISMFVPLKGDCVTRNYILTLIYYEKELLLKLISLMLMLPTTRITMITIKWWEVYLVVCNLQLCKLFDGSQSKK